MLTVGRLLAAVVIALAAVGMHGVTAFASSSATVDASIDINSTEPGIGCLVEVAVTLSTAGDPVPGVAVEAALHIDTDLIGAAHGSTTEDGSVLLQVDTSSTGAWNRLWLDVNLSGVYLTGVPVRTTDSSSCNDAPKTVETSGAVDLGWSSTSVGTGSAGGVWVPAYAQQRNLSCEFASLYIATSAWDDPVSEYAFDELVGWSPNPHYGFRGDITGWWGNTVDYGVYAEPLSWALAEFGFYGEVLYAAGDSSVLTSRLDAAIPVVVWISQWGEQGYYETWDDETYKLVSGMHVMVAYAYDDAGVYLSDPAYGVYTFYTWDDFMSMWNVLDGMALAVSPA